jgi:hypothetical protein
MTCGFGFLLSAELAEASHRCRSLHWIGIRHEQASLVLSGDQAIADARFYSRLSLRFAAAPIEQ